MTDATSSDHGRLPRRFRLQVEDQGRADQAEADAARMRGQLRGVRLGKFAVLKYSRDPGLVRTGREIRVLGRRH